ncbi:MAG: CRISPR-associated endonuclease Cas3'' [Proteobacteria bacterium]|nr:CRISPR-associated endonuclease Cas3'' [Pseudomonadota bacterium]
MDFPTFFHTTTGHAPYPYQQRLATAPWPELLDVPTGLGKTAAVVVAWLWRRVVNDEELPRRLVYCLPMRTLVEQTEGCCRNWLDKAGLAAQVDLHVLMGGRTGSDWVERPERPAILIGTQDQLLSRALMRGYAMSRYRWPVDFALLHNDALWVYDEVQLMGPGLPTGAQLEAFRRAPDWPTARPGRSLWLSATLHPDWLATVDFAAAVPGLVRHGIEAADRADAAVARRLLARKRLQPAGIRLTAADARSGAYARSLAAQALATHAAGTLTLLVLNTVERAQQVWKALNAQRPAADCVLLHGRFRPGDRQRQQARLDAPLPAAGRIVVATQCLEAGVDVSARTLFTELAPWASLVQRCGRCNRKGEYNDTAEAAVYWIDCDDPALAAPYPAADLDAARAVLAELGDAGPDALPKVAADAALHPVLRRRDFLELFDTDPDLSGFDVDVSAWIRDADDADLLLFWRELPVAKNGFDADGQPRPAAAELCRAGIGAANAFLKSRREAAFVWDGLTGQWLALRERRLHPGMTVLVAAAAGGYAPESGFAPDSRAAVPPPATDLPADAPPPADIDDDRRSFIGRYVGLAEHLADAEAAARALCTDLAEPHAEAVIRAARWHDTGKAHPVFQQSLQAALPEGDPRRSPDQFWAKSEQPGGRHARPHLRHELGSLLYWLAAHGWADDPASDLIGYLLLAHHGKVRTRLRALPGEQEPAPQDQYGPRFARGFWEREALPALRFADGAEVPAVSVDLELMELGRGAHGPSWTARVQRLLALHGPFRLAWLETLVRIADWRASAQKQEPKREDTP